MENTKTFTILLFMCYITAEKVRLARIFKLKILKNETFRSSRCLGFCLKRTF